MSERDPTPWLTAARAGSHEALGQGLERYRRYLLQIAQHGLDPDLRAKGGASDLVQEAFLEAYRDFANFQGTTEAEFRAWLRQLLLHRAAKFRRHFRAQKRRAAREHSIQAGSSSTGREDGLRADVPSASGQAVAREQAEALRRIIDDPKLPEDYRTVLHLRYREDRSWEEIGRMMNRSADAARLLWLRAFDRVKQELGLTDEA